MANDLATSCPLCLGTQDPADIVHAEIESTFPPGPRRIGVCRLCANAIAKAVKDTGDLPPVEVSNEQA